MKDCNQVKVVPWLGSLIGRKQVLLYLIKAGLLMDDMVALTIVDQG